jgi:hypothetical protein
MEIDRTIAQFQKEINLLHRNWNLKYTLKSFVALALIISGVAFIILGSLVSTGIALLILGTFLFFRQIHACQQANSLTDLAHRSISNLPNTTHRK